MSSSDPVPSLDALPVTTREVKLAEDGSCYLDSEGNRYPRVSHVIETFFGGAKDPRLLLTNMNPDNRKRKYGDQTDEVILRQWEENKELSCSLGTKMHDEIERFLLSQGDNGPAESTVTTEEETSSDFDRFKECFWQPLVVEGKMRFYAAEQRLTYRFSDKFRLAGTFDAMFTNERGEYVLCDWKRSKGIRVGDTFPRLAASAPSTKLGWHDNSWFHYSLQLNIYRRMWQTAYPEKKVVQLLLVCMHMDHPGDRVMEVPIMKDSTLDYVFKTVEDVFAKEHL